MTMKKLCLGVVAGVGMLTQSVMAAGALTPSASAEGGQLYGGLLNQCRTELMLLKSLNAPVYQREEQALNADLAAATRYLLMRTRLDEGMQETLDRLHQANLTRTCQQIHNVLFNQLLSSSVIAVKSGN
ncbi:hypothetical protein ABT880_001144 [Salmonella enterica subsp. enterica serovar Thompson]|nr:hypothetical protein [Salmonella enterica]EBY1098256.1 hypothetical protein [Salmonella enterica subsp. enterica serovar Sandiego]ECO1040175.1 hypothetical protein [Salmonella enterica subsp. enterica serovar Newport]EDT1690140.1 hypothetical protein [Salmonella enterica subsp. enterica serovar Oslo]ECO1045203.1 hypothetical protein [Salmonella enterica subsp. enterica serovar Newport]